MPNTSSTPEATLTPGGVLTVTSSQASITITPEEVMAHYLDETSPDPQSSTLIWIKNLLVSTFGESIWVPQMLIIDYDVDSGKIIYFERRSIDNG